MNKLNLTVYFVSFKTPVLCEILISSFEKFKTENFNLNYIVVENSSFDLSKAISKKFNNININIYNNDIEGKLSHSHAHGSGLEYAKNKITTDYVFTCHSDVCVTSSNFFNKLNELITNGTDLAGVCEDLHEKRVKALHCSGLLAKTKIFQNVSLMPSLPKIDTADKLTMHCRENNLKIFLFKNTYNDKKLNDICNEPYKSLGPDCGVDRCLLDTGEVIYMHHGRGTIKHHGQYHNVKKLTTNDWINLCNYVLRRDQ